MGDFKPGDKVRWPSPQGMTHGKIVKKVTSDTAFDGLNVHATPDDPRYIVQSGKSGKYAAHRGDVLRKL